MTTVWVNGDIVGERAPSLSALDHGITVGDGVFETALVQGGRPFALTRHLRRLARSAATVGIEAPTEDDVRAAVAETLEAAGSMNLGRLRITVTAGVGPLGSDRGDASPSLVVAVTETAGWPAEVNDLIAEFADRLT